MRLMTIVARLSAHPKEALAVVTNEREISYGELRSDVQRTAAHLRAEGIGPGSKVGIHFGSPRVNGDYSFWVAHLAALRVGATHASLYDQASLEHLLARSAIEVVIGMLPDGVEPNAKLKVVPLVLADLPKAKAAADDEARAERLNLSSGTTGMPKLIRWDSALIEARIAQLADLGVIGPDTCLDSYLSARTTGGFRYPLATWMAGGSVLLADEGPLDEPDRAARSTLCLCSPFQLQRLKAKDSHWPGIERRTIVALGGRVPPQLRDWALANLASKVLISYGSTETGSVAHGDAAVTDRHAGAVGWVRGDAEVQVVGPDGHKVEAGKIGRLRVRTRHMAPAGTAESAAEEEWFEPGDFGLLFEDGLLAIGGRVGEVLNIGGIKLAAPDIEAKFTALAHVEDATATVLPSPQGDMLWIALVPRGALTANDILPWAKPLIPGGVPFRLVVVDAIPRNAMGKIERVRLIERIRNHLRATRERQHA